MLSLKVRERPSHSIRHSSRNPLRLRAKKSRCDLVKFCLRYGFIRYAQRSSTDNVFCSERPSVDVMGKSSCFIGGRRLRMASVALWANQIS